MSSRYTAVVSPLSFVLVLHTLSECYTFALFILSLLFLLKSYWLHNLPSLRLYSTHIYYQTLSLLIIIIDKGKVTICISLGYLLIFLSRHKFTTTPLFYTTIARIVTSDLSSIFYLYFINFKAIVPHIPIC